MHRLRPISEHAELIPGILCLGLLGIWTSSDAGYPATTWYPGALFLLGLLAVSLLAYRGRLRSLPRSSLLAGGLLAAFVAWSYLSIIWAGVPGDALTGANRTLLYLIIYALFAVILWRPRSAAIVLGLYSVVVAAVVFGYVSAAAGSDQATLSVISGRFAEPAGYPNAVAALCIGAVWPAALLAARREVPWPIRGLMLAVAGLLLQMALLPQSRGAIFVFPLAVGAYLLVAPQRIRVTIAATALAVATVLTAPTILDVFTVTDQGGDPGAPLADARTAMLISFGALLLVGAAIGFADRMLEIPAATARLAGRVGGALTAVIAIAAIVVAVAVIGNPVSWAGDRWDDFKGGYDTSGFGTSRFSGDLGSNRYDFWRVAIDDEFAADPLIGGGADNFAVTYIQNRDSNEEPLYPHSLPIQVLAGTGIVGGALFAGFVVAALAAALAARRRGPDPLGRGVAAIAVAAFVYWGLHGLGDWLWSFPALTAPIFAWLGVSASLGRRTAAERADAAGDGAELTPSRSRWPRLPIPAPVGLAALAALGLVAAVAFALPWAAERDVETAAGSWGADPAAAFERLDRARGLNPLSASPDLTAGTIASEMGDLSMVRDSFSRALDRDPDNWYALLELGAAELLDGERQAGLEHLERARELNPRDELIRQVQQRGRRSDPMTLARINDVLLERVCSVVGATDATRFCR